jgi:predicted membrane channel-forming protein YqfA (hemolysin III family)
MERLLRAEEVPPHARYALIVNGYPTGPVRLHLLFTWHVETANTWTHLAALAWECVQISDVSSRQDIDAVARAWLCFFHVCAAAAFALSSLAHAFGGGAVLSPSRSIRLWSADFVGILLMACGMWAPALRWAFRCHPGWQCTYATLVAVPMLAAAWCSQSSPGSHAHKNFAACLMASGTSAFLPFCHWMGFASVLERSWVAPRFLLMMASMAFGALCWACSPIERLAVFAGMHSPKYIFSHTLWHISVVGAVCLWADIWSDSHMLRGWETALCGQ